MSSMIPQPQNQQQAPKKKPKFRKSWIVLGVVVLVFVIFLIVKGNSSAPTPDTSQPEQSQPVISSSTPEPQPITQTSSGALEEIAPPKESTFTKSGTSFVFNRDVSFPAATTMADENVISLGNYVSYTPMKSCAFKFSANKIDISHSSGAAMSIQRSSYRGDLNYEDIDKAITENFTEGLAGEVTLANVYLGSVLRGRSGSGQVKFNDSTYYMNLTYLFSNDEVITIVAVSDIGDEDFVDILYRNISISGQKLTVA